MAPVFTALLLKKLESIGTVSHDDEEALRSLSGSNRELASGEAVVREGDNPTNLTFLQSGLLCRHKHVSEVSDRYCHFTSPVTSLTCKVSSSMSWTTPSRLWCVPTLCS